MTTLAFEGASYLVHSGALTGVSDGKVFVFFARLTLDESGDGTVQRIVTTGESPYRIQIQRAADNHIYFRLRNSAGTLVCGLDSVSVYASASGTIDLMASVDLAAGIGQLYVNGASDLVGSPTLVNDAIQFSVGDWGIGAHPSGLDIFCGRMENLYLAIGASLDFSQAANRAKFVNADGSLADLGPDGSAVTGAAPAIFLGDSTANLGSGGNFSVHRSFGGSSPSMIDLWPAGQVPGAQGTSDADIPAVEVFAPANPNGTAVLVIHGGAYSSDASDSQHAFVEEGEAAGAWLAEQGITAFVLKYRAAPPYDYPMPLWDAQRAVRWIRHNTASYGIDPGKIGLWGFSAGGHLASTLMTRGATDIYTAGDAVDEESVGVDFLILAYAVITMVDPWSHVRSRTNLIGTREDATALAIALSNDRNVTATAVPTFLFHTSDDEKVGSQNAVSFYDALLANEISAELHLYEHGAHGCALGSADPILSTWPDRLLAWLQANGWA